MQALIADIIAGPISSLSPIFDRAAGWMNAQDPVNLAAAAACFAVAAAFGTLGLRNYFNNRAIDRTLAQLESGPTIAIRSAEDAVGKGMTAEAAGKSEETALKMALKIDWKYGSLEECKAHHLQVERWKVTSGSPGLFASTALDLPLFGVGLTSTEVEYHPAIVGWQVRTDNPTVAMPLYSGPSENIGVRSDGKKFTLS